MTCPRIDQAGLIPTHECVIKTGLILHDAVVDLVVTTLPILPHDDRIGQEGTGHADKVGIPPLQHPLGYGGRVDAVGSAWGAETEL